MPTKRDVTFLLVGEHLTSRKTISVIFSSFFIARAQNRLNLNAPAPRINSTLAPWCRLNRNEVANCDNRPLNYTSSWWLASTGSLWPQTTRGNNHQTSTSRSPASLALRHLTAPEEPTKRRAILWFTRLSDRYLVSVQIYFLVTRNLGPYASTVVHLATRW